MKGKIISLEGLECCGKSTQVPLLKDFLTQKDLSVFMAREPGGTAYGEALRALIKHPRLAIEAINSATQNHEDFVQAIPTQIDRLPMCELLLLLASRTEFVEKIIKPQVGQGTWLILDRYYDSSRAYQGGGRFHSRPDIIDIINRLHTLIVGQYKPDLTFFIDISVEEMIRRRQLEADKDAFFEKECDLNFFRRARAEFLAIAKEEAHRVVVINGEQSPEAVWQDIKTTVERRLLNYEATSGNSSHQPRTSIG